jgi:hypothetical protein
LHVNGNETRHNVTFPEMAEVGLFQLSVIITVYMKYRQFAVRETTKRINENFWGEISSTKYIYTYNEHKKYHTVDMNCL